MRETAKREERPIDGCVRTQRRERERERDRETDRQTDRQRGHFFLLQREISIFKEHTFTHC